MMNMLRSRITSIHCRIVVVIIKKESISGSRGRARGTHHRYN